MTKEKTAAVLVKLAKELARQGGVSGNMQISMRSAQRGLREAGARVDEVASSCRNIGNILSERFSETPSTDEKIMLRHSISFTRGLAKQLEELNTTLANYVKQLSIIEEEVASYDGGG